MHFCSTQLFLLGAALWLTSSLCQAQVVAISDFSNMGRSLQRSRITNYDGELYFSVGVDDTTIRELWRFDGVNVDIIQGGFVGDSEISLDEFTPYRGELYFRADAGTHGQELYKYDGERVSLVADIATGESSSSPVGLHVHNDALYFSAQEGNSFNNLWKFDGTSTTRIATFDNPRASVVTGGSLNGDLYFGADDGVNGMELWKYDGSNVTLAADINPGNSDSFPRDFTPVGDQLYFRAFSEATGQEVWRINDRGVSILADMNPGAKSSDSGYMRNVDGELYFSAVAYGDRSVYRTEGDQVVRLLEGGGPVDIGGGELATIQGRKVQGTELNDLYRLDGSFLRTTVPSAGAFEAYEDNVYFGCACAERELYRLAKSGDANADGTVDFSDFLVMSTNFGNEGKWQEGDFTNDGMISFGDFLDLSQNFGQDEQPTTRRFGLQSVPEPNMGAGMVWALICLVLHRRRTR